MIARSIVWVTLSLMITISSVVPILFLQVPVRLSLIASSTLQLTSENWDDLYPNFSPNGQSIVFASSRSGNLAIWVMNSRGMHQSRLTFMAGEQTHPEFDPSGSRIAFLAGSRENSANLWLMDADGTEQKNMGEFGTIGTFQWSPDGHRIVWSGPLYNENTRSY